VLSGGGGGCRCAVMGRWGLRAVGGSGMHGGRVGDSKNKYTTRLKVARWLANYWVLMMMVSDEVDRSE